MQVHSITHRRFSANNFSQGALPEELYLDTFFRKLWVIAIVAAARQDLPLKRRSK
jgi:hypothetical protein